MYYNEYDTAGENVGWPGVMAFQSQSRKKYFVIQNTVYCITRKTNIANLQICIQLKCWL